MKVLFVRQAPGDPEDDDIFGPDDHPDDWEDYAEGSEAWGGDDEEDIEGSDWLNDDDYDEYEEEYQDDFERV